MTTRKETICKVWQSNGRTGFPMEREVDQLIANHPRIRVIDILAQFEYWGTYNWNPVKEYAELDTLSLETA
tara:strand:- start:1561 stop:1773 length:213 start_codon:yes stop_codon:yes gene_type:complete